MHSLIKNRAGYFLLLKTLNFRLTCMHACEMHPWSTCGKFYFYSINLFYFINIYLLRIVRRCMHIMHFPHSCTAVLGWHPHCHRCADRQIKQWGGCRGYYRDPWFALNFLREMWLLLFNPREPWFAYYRDPWFQKYFPRYPWKRPHFRCENDENFRKMSVLLTIFNEK